MVADFQAAYPDQRYVDPFPPLLSPSPVTRHPVP